MKDSNRRFESYLPSFSNNFIFKHQKVLYESQKFKKFKKKSIKIKNGSP